jgi:hypothetical protein
VCLRHKIRGGRTNFINATDNFAGLIFDILQQRLELFLETLTADPETTSMERTRLS